METLKETFKQYKWVLLAGVIVAILIGLITANLHVLRFMSYKMQNNTQGIISILQSNIRSNQQQDDWFFTQGVDYLVEQEEYTEEIKGFFETNFAKFSIEKKQQIIKAYNIRNLYLNMNADLMSVLIENINDDTIKAYIRRLSPENFEQGLVLVYGNNPEVNSELINGLDEVLNIYPKQISFEKFQFNLYDLLNYTGEKATEQKKRIISKLPKEIVREYIFKELKTESITEEQLCEWVKFFNETEIITNSEFTAFNNAYSEIVLIRSQYKGLDEEQVELQNKKDQVDLQISDSLKAVEEKQSKIAAKQSEISAIETHLDELTNYTHMPLYIEKLAGTGNNEYIASAPRGGWLEIYIPSSQKYIVKLNSTELADKGVTYLDVYFKGTKQTSSGDEYAYYVQVSNADLAQISSRESERNTKLKELESLKAEVSKLENKIETIKNENNYDENQQALMSIATKREELSTKLSEKTLIIKELFGLKDLRISLEA